MEKKHKDLEDQFETMNRGIIETANRKSDSTDIDTLGKKLILRFKIFNFYCLFILLWQQKKRYLLSL